MIHRDLLDDGVTDGFYTFAQFDTPSRENCDEWVCKTILGSNGAGKTTILKTISGAIDPRKGKVFLSGSEIQKKDPDKILRLGMSHAPEGREVFPYCSVLENLEMGAYTRSDSKEVKDDLERVYNYFPRLHERRTSLAGYTSGGEQQMIAIGRALMAHPTMILLDEPSMGLAPQLVKQIFEIVAEINKKEGVTILLAEQNTNELYLDRHQYTL